MRIILVALVLLSSGCAQPAVEPAPETPPPPLPEPPRAPDEDVEAALAATPSPTPRPPWPPVDAARIRPGMSIVPEPYPGGVAERGTCSSAFLFRSQDNATLYLSTAAHCVEGVPLGGRVRIGESGEAATLAYSSLLTMEATNESDDEVRLLNDFALLALDEGSRGSVHPAALYYGGPVGTGTPDSLVLGDGVLHVGNTSVRLKSETLQRNRGVFTNASDWVVEARLATPAVPGDSGSLLMDARGAALGVVILFGVEPPSTASARALRLDAALAYAREHAHVEVELVTWPLIDASALRPKVP